MDLENYCYINSKMTELKPSCHYCYYYYYCHYYYSKENQKLVRIRF